MSEINWVSIKKLLSDFKILLHQFRYSNSFCCIKKPILFVPISDILLLVVLFYSNIMLTLMPIKYFVDLIFQEKYSKLTTPSGLISYHISFSYVIFNLVNLRVSGYIYPILSNITNALINLKTRLALPFKKEEVKGFG